MEIVTLDTSWDCLLAIWRSQQKGSRLREWCWCSRLREFRTKHLPQLFSAFATIHIFCPWGVPFSESDQKKNSSIVCLRESAKGFWVFIASRTSTLNDKLVPKKFQIIYCCFNGLGIRFPWTSIIKVHTSIRNTFGSQILGDYQMLLDHQLHIRKLGYWKITFSF